MITFIKIWLVTIAMSIIFMVMFVNSLKNKIHETYPDMQFISTFAEIKKAFLLLIIPFINLCVIISFAFNFNDIYDLALKKYFQAKKQEEREDSERW